MYVNTSRDSVSLQEEDSPHRKLTGAASGEAVFSDGVDYRLVFVRAPISASTAAIAPKTMPGQLASMKALNKTQIPSEQMARLIILIEYRPPIMSFFYFLSRPERLYT
jgi:hypothetical protein